jgi:hypothetical protein
VATVQDTSGAKDEARMKVRGRMVGEFLLIVIGVLVALMVEAALDERQDDALRDEYYSRVRADIEADKLAVGHRIEFFIAVQKFSLDTLEWLESDRPLDQDVLLASFYAAEVWPFVPNLSTYQDLQSTGNIRLMDGIDFRTSLAAYYNKADASRPGWNPSDEYRSIIRGVIPTRVQSQIRQHCPTTDKFDLAPTGFPPCSPADIDYNEMNALYERLRDDRSFREILTYRNSELGVMIYLLRQQAVYADEVLSRIENQ